MTLTVITHTKFGRPELLERCKASVQAALPPGGQHLIIECPTYEQWVQQRARDATSHELVAFVDDDDYVHPDAFKRCLAAMEQTGLAAACTDEVEVDINGKSLNRSHGRKTYYDSTVHPRVIHHVCVMRGKLVDAKRVTELQQQFGVGVDWFIRESVVLPYGCAHVPMDGHFWTQHPGQHTQHTRQLYGQHMRAMQQAIRATWPMNFKGDLPVVTADI